MPPRTQTDICLEHSGMVVKIDGLVTTTERIEQKIDALSVSSAKPSETDREGNPVISLRLSFRQILALVAAISAVAAGGAAGLSKLLGPLVGP